MKRFLSAEWRDLILANYEVPRELLLPRVPHGVELDDHDGRVFVSLVAFKFHRTKLRDIMIPGHVNFVEVNLRFYVKRQMEGEVRRGTTFIKEFVPRQMISQVARFAYGEPYETWSTGVSEPHNQLCYCWSKRQSRNSIEIEKPTKIQLPGLNSHGEFITEHYWGYTKRKENHTSEYRVTHPQWEQSVIENYQIKVDFERCYGKEFAFLNDQIPYSVLFALGSEIEIFPGINLRE